MQAANTVSSHWATVGHVVQAKLSPAEQCNAVPQLVQHALHDFYHMKAYQGDPEVSSGEAREVKDCTSVVDTGGSHHMLEIL